MSRINKIPRIVVGLLLLVGVGAVWLLPTPALADHGSWSDHDLHWFESGTSNYGSYADVDATDQYDYGHARWERFTTGGTLLEWETVTCNASEGCGYRKTYTQYFAQTTYILQAKICANDGTHKLSGVSNILSACASKGLYTHEHSAQTH